MMERTDKQTGEKGYRQKATVPGGKHHYTCTLCHENYELTEEQQAKITCCGIPVNKTEETFFSTPEPFGP